MLWEMWEMREWEWELRVGNDTLQRPIMAEISVSFRSLRLTSKTTLTSTEATSGAVTAERLLKPSNALIEISCYNGSIIGRNLTMH